MCVSIYMCRQSHARKERHVETRNFMWSPKARLCILVFVKFGVVNPINLPKMDTYTHTHSQFKYARNTNFP